MYTLEEFIRKAREVHGNKYDYSKVELVDNDTKVTIICPEHGEFPQSPKSHIVRKYGCRKCGRNVCANKTKKTTEQFIKEAREIHGDKYDYSKVEYINAFTNVTIICPIHGEFQQSPHDHLKGCGCNECGKIKTREALSDTKEEFIRKARNVHGDKYDYSKVDYVNQNTDVTIICPIHGEFDQTPGNHLIGCGCDDCGNERIRDSKLIKKPDFIKRCNKIFNSFYDYTKTDLKHRDEKGRVIVTCPIHGDFPINPSSHLQGHGCKECGDERSRNARLSNTEEFITKSKKVHNGKYDYSLVEYERKNKNVAIICPKHGPFPQTPEHHLRGEGCPMCGNQLSRAEDEISKFFREYLGEKDVQQRNRILIHPYELDIYLRSLKVAIEYNGLRWHSEQYGKDRRYHLNKLNACKDRGIKLIQIFEDEYIHHRDLVYEKLKHIIGLDQNLPKIAGRKCVVKEIKAKEAKEFLNAYHIQGYVGSRVYLGAFYEDKLIAVMTFKQTTKDSGKWELTRFASDYHYICQGVGGKLFKYFITNYNPQEIKSFADRRWTIDEENNIYTKLGFIFDSYTEPEYRYYKPSDGMIRQHKFGFRKDRLHKKYGLDINMTEDEMIDELGYTKIWDCGMIKYTWKNGKIGDC